MRRVTLAVALACTLLGFPAAARTTRVSSEDLMRVVTPSAHGTAIAHPFVNVIVRFGTTAGGVPADPRTFKARIRNANITDEFRPIVENGQTTGMRAKLEQPLIRLGGDATNRVRLWVRSTRGSAGTKTRAQTVHDVDRLVFRATLKPDVPPSCTITGSLGVLVPASAMHFDGTQSQDQDLDEVTYVWDFGDGATSTDPQPTHVYTPTQDERVVQLTVSDGQQSTACAVHLVPAPLCDAGTTPGTVGVTAADALEFASVPPGSSATKTFTVTNTDATPGSQLKARIATDNAAFAVAPTDFVLGPGESTPVTVTFAPAATGHQTATIALVACTASQQGTAVVAHGYGGVAPGTGPTLSADLLFSQGSSIVGIFPSGQRFVVDNSANVCLGANGTGTGDLCYDNADCRAAGETCVSPGAVTASFDPSSYCGDGLGNLYVVSEDTVTDPSNADQQVTGSLVRLHFDATGARTEAAVLRRLTADTTQVACDGTALDAGGLAFIAEDYVVNPPASCFRSEREALEGIHKSDGTLVTFPGFDRIDAYESPPLDACNNDIDPVDDLEVARDDSAVFFLPDNGGIYQLRPTPLPIVQSTALLSSNRFQVHPDGSILYAVASDVGSTGVISLYKVFPEQARHGAVRLEDLAPCASFTVPNNVSSTGTSRSTRIVSFASDRTAPGASDATVLVSFRTGGSPVASPTLRVQGTVAFSAPAESSACTPLGLITLEPLDMLSF